MFPVYRWLRTWWHDYDCNYTILINIIPMNWTEKQLQSVVDSVEPIATYRRYTGCIACLGQNKFNQTHLTRWLLACVCCWRNGMPSGVGGAQFTRHTWHNWYCDDMLHHHFLDCDLCGMFTVTPARIWWEPKLLRTGGPEAIQSSTTMSAFRVLRLYWFLE